MQLNGDALVRKGYCGPGRTVGHPTLGVFSVLVKPEYDPVLQSFRRVGKKYGFNVIRTDKDHTSERILPRIENEIRHSAFVIADLSDVSRNVYYEVGFAMGLQKEIVFTAKKGTPLPFDVVDVPVLWWTTQADLQSKLSARVKAIKKARE